MTPSSVTTSRSRSRVPVTYLSTMRHRSCATSGSFDTRNRRSRSTTAYFSETAMTCRLTRGQPLLLGERRVEPDEPHRVCLIELGDRCPRFHEIRKRTVTKSPLAKGRVHPPDLALHRGAMQPVRVVLFLAEPQC